MDGSLPHHINCSKDTSSWKKKPVWSRFKYVLLIYWSQLDCWWALLNSRVIMSLSFCWPCISVNLWQTVLQRCFADFALIIWTGRKLLPSLYSAYRQPIYGSATYKCIVFIYGGLFVVKCSRGFCFFSEFHVFHHCLPYKVLYCIFNNVPVMSAKDTLETYLQLEAYYKLKFVWTVYYLNHYEHPLFRHFKS